MKNYLGPLILALCFCLSVPALAHYDKRMGLRFSSGASAYTALSSFSYGVLVPLQADFTYGFTKAVEGVVGFRGVISAPINSKDAYALPYSIYLAIRYYYNVNEPVKAYNTLGFFTALDRLGFEFVPLNWGLQWDITEQISIFGDGGLALSLTSNQLQAKIKEVNLRFGANFGVSYRF